MATALGTYTRNKMAPPEEFVSWKADPSEEKYAALLNSLDPVVNSAMQTFAGGNPAFRTRARILTAQAIQSYDPQKGASLRTHVFNTLQRLQRVSAERGQAVHVPENVRADASRIRSYVDEYTSEKGYEPSQGQVADALALSLRRVRKAQGIGELPESAMLSDKGDLQAARSAERIWMDYVYHDLDEKNRKILEWTTGYGGAKTIPKSEIAKRLGISPAAVSLRINRIAAMLQEGVQ